MHRCVFLLLTLSLFDTVRADDALPLFALPDYPEITAGGSAVAPLATGAVAVLLNPAGMSAGRHSEIALSMGFLYQDIRRHTGAVAVPLPSARVGDLVPWVGLSVSSVSYGSMERRTGPSTTPEGTYGAGDIRLGAALASSPFDGFHLGIGVSWSEAQISDITGSATALDAGAVYSLSSPALDFGASCINLATLHSDERLGDLARAVQGTMRWKTFRGRVRIAAGVRLIGDDDPEVLSGVEYAIGDLALRAGRIFGHDTAGFTAGVGATVRDLNIAYSFEEHGLDLGSSHRVGLTWRL